VAKEHAKAVRDSDLYEHGGLRKPLLEKIALLIIRPLEEKETPPDWWRDDFVGWCVLPQERIAAELGCSVEQVCRNIALFVRDGWLTMDTYEAANGSEHNKYAITPAQMKKIRDRKMKVDDRGHFIRGRSESKSRKSKQTSMDNLVWNKPLDTESKGLMTRSQEGGCVGVKGLLDTESIESSGNPSFIGKKIAQKEKATPTPTPRENPASLRSKEGKENQSQPRERQGNPIPADGTTPIGEFRPAPPRRPAPPPKTFLSKEVWDKLASFGCPSAVLAEVTKLEHWSKALNNTSNVVSSYETLALKPNGTATRMFKVWMPKRVLSGGFEDECYDQANEESILQERAKPKEERILKAARQWWNYLGMDNEEGGDRRRHELIDFPVGYRSHFKVPDEQVVAAYHKWMEDARREDHERVMKLDRDAKERKAKGKAA
jgi:hypothetical protein